MGAGFFMFIVIDVYAYFRSVHPKTINAVGLSFYLLLSIPVSILTSMQYVNLLTQTISEINREYWNNGGARAAYVPSNGGLVYINLQTEYVLPSSTRYGQFRKLGKIGVGAPFSPPTPKETVFARVRVRGYLRVRFDILSSKRFPQLGAHNPYWGPIILIRGHPRGSRVVPLDSTYTISY